jgi:DNA-directed RNA polymerase specialized sigma24 family protein
MLHRILATLRNGLHRRVPQRSKEIYLAYRAGYTYEEISAHCGISHRRIKAHVHRALLAIVEDEWHPKNDHAALPRNAAERE